MKARLTDGGQSIIIELATGDTLTIVEQPVLSTEGFAVSVMADLIGGGKIIVMPNAANSVILTTPRALKAQTEAVSRIAADRNARNGRT